ncbi:RING-H2 finger protein ATL70 [Vitis riparia]|uniref:RING-H2 finger protein ATL70 n=1 Tax=Vitis riparia TaxID=96939 RepID=UPI00155AF389|nr:RING-H2 finger protein ATL70 [Vitis riparia]
MNGTADSGGFMGSNNIGGLGYGIGVSVGILLLITTITLASYFCTRPQQVPAAAYGGGGGLREQQPVVEEFVVDVGLDEATILSYPKMVYSEAKLQHKDSTAACCSICLADYKDSDMLRLLPDCGHLFHLKCVDPWLRLHPTCPVCRTSPMPTPLSTPLAEVVPLATRRD